MRFSHPARRPLIVTAAALTAAAMLTGGSTAAFADTSYTPVVYTAGSVSDSRAAALSDPLSDITDKAAAALADAQTAIDDARATEDEVTGADVAVAGQTTLDTSALSEVVDRLGKYQLTPLMLLPRLVEEATTATSAVTTATDDLSARLGAAQAAKEAAEKAAAAAKAAAEHAAELKAEAEAKAAAEKAAAEKAAAEKAAAEKAAAEKAAAEQATQSSASAAAPAAAAPAVNVNVDPASAQGIARSMAAAQYGWGDGEFACLVSLWNRESGWRVNAANGSGAYGIPQALPGSKMASAGADWATNPATQIAWGLGYISGRYGSPCGAWNHSQSVGWY